MNSSERTNMGHPILTEAQLLRVARLLHGTAQADTELTLFYQELLDDLIEDQELLRLPLYGVGEITRL